MAGFRELSRAVRDGGAGFRVGEVTVRTPEGEVVRRRYLHTPDVVAVVAVDRGDLLLVNEFRAAVGETILQVPMGKMLPEGRDPLACAEDELAEETGFLAGRWVAAGKLLAAPGWMDQVVHVFLATELTELTSRRPSDDPGDVEERHAAVVRMPVAEFGAAIATGRVRDARTIAAVRVALG